MKTLREIRHEKTIKKYKEIYNDVQKGIGMNILWKTYKFKNKESLRALYHGRIVPLRLNNWVVKLWKIANEEEDS